MSLVPIARLAVAALLVMSSSAGAGSIEIDLPAALDRAHTRSSAAIAAGGEVAIARGAVVAAELPFTENPEIEAGAGPRLTSGRPLDLELRLEQNLELGRREPRRRLARAGVAHRQAEVAAALRQLDLEVAMAFYEALFAERSAELAQRGEELARTAADAAIRRRKAGEITDLDANLARSALGRARAASAAARGDRIAAAGRLAVLIGAGPEDALVLHGELRPPPLPEAQALRGSAARPDIQVLDAEREVAAAERGQADAAALPQLSAWASYQREDTEAIVLGGVRLTLPAWNRAQGDRAAAQARERRAIATRDATRRVAERQIADAVAAYALARDAVDTFERDVAPVLDDSEQLLQKTIAAGQIAVSDYLVARQELLAGRREHLERLLALARAAAFARFAAGGSP